jgi:hypothetical protein
MIESSEIMKNLSRDSEDLSSTIDSLCEDGNLNPTVPEKSGECDTPLDQLPPPKRQRLWHLDFARIVCVACVVCEHSGGSKNYTEKNVVFVLQWVLPYLYLTSGMCFMLSSAPLSGYLARLTLVFVVGCGANLASYVILGLEWQNDIGNVIFQMFYVLMLIVMAFVTSPLRLALRQRFKAPADEAGKLEYVQVAAWALLFIVGLIFFCSAVPLFDITDSKDTWVGYNASLLNSAPIIMVEVATVVLVILLGCVFGIDGMIGWLLLVVIYLPRVIVPWRFVGYMHNVQLYIFAMVVQTWSLKGSDAIARCCKSYWPLFLACLMITSTPGLSGRCDLWIPNTYWLRLRFYSIECALTIAFVTGAFNTSDPLKVTRWLNWWALYAYCFHVAWYRLLPGAYGPFFTYACMIPFFALDVLLGKMRARSTPRIAKKTKSMTSDEFAQESSTNVTPVNEITPV